MQKLLLFLAPLFTIQICYSQQQYRPAYNQLKEFEGLYEYSNQTTLKIAASPRDTCLYAIINESKYQLKPVDRDLFFNMQKEKVVFFRNQSNEITGYCYNQDSFRLLSKNVFFPNSMWYARPSSSKNFRYQYQQPSNLKDGLITGDVKHSGLNTKLLEEMLLKIVDGTYANVHSVLIIKDGRLVFEEYFYEYNQDSLHELRSATKSFVSALTGIAIEKGFIKSKYESVLSYFPEYNFNNNTKDKKRITIEDLLAQQSGLDCDISNDKSQGNETKMNQSADWIKFTLDLPMVDTPGGRGMYCSGNSIVTARIIEKTTHQPLASFANKYLFEPMGINMFKWNFKPDVSSAETFCQLYLRPRDMAKFGLLFLNNGNWNGKQLIPTDWIKQSLVKHSTIQNVDYGYLWWIKYLDADGVRYYARGAQGNGGQRIYIWQEQNMVTVITGGSYNTQSPSDELIRKYILPSFNKQ